MPLATGPNRNSQRHMAAPCYSRLYHKGRLHGILRRTFGIIQLNSGQDPLLGYAKASGSRLNQCGLSQCITSGLLRLPLFLQQTEHQLLDRQSSASHRAPGPRTLPTAVPRPENSNREAPRCWRPVAGDSLVIYDMHTRIECCSKQRRNTNMVCCGLVLGCLSGLLHACALRWRLSCC